MEKFDEKCFQTQEEEAKKLARDKARELSRAKQDAIKRGGRMPGSGIGGGGYGSQGMRNGEPTAIDSSIPSDTKPAYSAPAPTKYGGRVTFILMGRP